MLCGINRILNKAHFNCDILTQPKEKVSGSSSIYELHSKKMAACITVCLFFHWKKKAQTRAGM